MAWVRSRGALPHLHGGGQILRQLVELVELIEMMDAGRELAGEQSCSPPGRGTPVNTGPLASLVQVRVVRHDPVEAKWLEHALLDRVVVAVIGTATVSSLMIRRAARRRASSSTRLGVCCPWRAMQVLTCVGPASVAAQELAEGKFGTGVLETRPPQHQDPSVRPGQIAVAKATPADQDR